MGVLENLLSSVNGVVQEQVGLRTELNQVKLTLASVIEYLRQPEQPVTRRMPMIPQAGWADDFDYRPFPRIASCETTSSS